MKTSITRLSFLLLTLFVSTVDMISQNDVLFQVESNSKGILIPSLTEVQRQAIVNPSSGLLVYQNNNVQGFYYYNGVVWLMLADESAIGINTQAIQDTATQIRADIPDVSGFLTSESDPSVPSGTQSGEVQYWNGTSWVTLAPGIYQQVLTFCNGTPTWTFNGSCPYPPGTVHCTATPTAIVDVTNPTTGETWMDRNLGATQVATSSTDTASYGDLYQWGRGADGHQCRSSNTTSILSSSDQPGHGNFITNPSDPYDWRSPQNTILWQGVNGINNPCPTGYRLPTEAELDAERTSWNSNNAAGAFASTLKLPLAGFRNHGPDGSVVGAGSNGHYWSTTVSGINSHRLGFYSSIADVSTGSRAFGFSVRCIKD